MSRDLEKYSEIYEADYGFESLVVAYRRRVLIERLHRINPKIIVEVGCGSELLYESWLREGGPAQCWMIIEPNTQFAHAAASSGLPNLEVFQGCLENTVDQVVRALPRAPDLVICSSLLHEVPSSTAFLSSVHAVMGPATRLHVNVPNSESLHRRLAHVMGLVPGTKTMSDRNLSLMQHRVYDIGSLRSELQRSGLRIVDQGGYLLKPCTHSQMERVWPELGIEVLDGLFLLGQHMPESASEIWVESERADRGA